MNGALRRAAALLALFAAPLAGTGAAAQGPGAPTHNFLVGRWTDDGNCANAVMFHRDGRFSTNQDTGGLWAVDGDRLILTGSATVVLRVTVSGPNRIEVVNADGSPGHSTRCGANGPAALPPLPKLDAAYFAGRWTDTGACADAADFRRDGHFVAANGAEGEWTLADDRLTLTGGNTIVVRLVALDANTINVINGNNSVGRSTRC